MAHQGCFWMSAMEYRLAGSATRICLRRSLQFSLTGMLLGKW